MDINNIINSNGNIIINELIFMISLIIIHERTPLSEFEIFVFQFSDVRVSLVLCDRFSEP